MCSFSSLKRFLLVLSVSLALCIVPAFAVVNLDNTPPVDSPYMGGYWVSGTSNVLGDVTIYVADNRGWTVNTSGELFRYTNTSTSGVMYDSNGTEYTFSAPAFSLPRYRLANSSGYTYTDLYFNPVGGNIIIENDFATPYDTMYYAEIVSVFLLGMLLVVNLTKAKRGG